MSADERRYLVVDATLGRAPEVERWLWALEDTRRRTLEQLEGLPAAALDWQPAGDESSIGAVLYHIAVIEADWLYTEVLEQPFPPVVAALFPSDVRDAQGHLVQVQGQSLERHLRRLESVRGLLLDAYRMMDAAEFRRARSLEAYDVTPEWVLHHLMQHEAEHRSQMGALRAGAESELTAG
jgi:uncharacterized damage-inducible protein DinB